VLREGVLQALNVPAAVRLAQLKINLVRLRAMSGNLGSRFVVCNIPAAQIEAIEGNTVVSRHIAVVGKPDRPSPDIQSRVVEINFNPYWTVPVSIVRKDLIPKMQVERKDARLTHPVPLYWVYVTGWATPDGIVQFRDDIYARDGAGDDQAVSGQAPREVYFEFTRIGPSVKVAAIDAASGIEVSVIGPATAAPADLQQLALAKLRARLAKEGP
jgi:murein L,D-transpeptidase YcbB/YkuD